MGKDSKSKEAGSKGKGKQAAAAAADGGSGKGKAKGSAGGKADGLGTCTYVKARHILCEKQAKINEAYKKLQDGWLENGDKVPPAEFAKIAAEYSECPSGKKGGDLGWFPRGKMAGPFQDVAFATPVGATSAPFKSTRTIIICLLDSHDEGAIYVFHSFLQVDCAVCSSSQEFSISASGQVTLTSDSYLLEVQKKRQEIIVYVWLHSLASDEHKRLLLP